MSDGASKALLAHSKSHPTRSVVPALKNKDASVTFEAPSAVTIDKGCAGMGSAE